MARDTALAAGCTSFFPGPFVSGALFVGHPAALAGNLTLFLSIHRGESAIFYGHRILLPPLRRAVASAARVQTLV